MSNKQIGFLFSWGFLLVFSLLISAVWFMSPLGIGFNYDPDLSPIKKKIGETIYFASYFIGIPLLLIFQVISGIIGVKGNTRQAIWLSVLTLILFVGMVITSLSVLT